MKRKRTAFFVLVAVCAFVIFPFLSCERERRAAIRPRARPRTHERARHPRESVREVPRVPYAQKMGSSSNVAAWDLPMEPSVWFAIMEAFPEADYNPWEESVDDFCERASDANDIAYVFFEGSVSVGQIERSENEDGSRSCTVEDILKIEAVMGADAEDSGYVVVSEITSGVYDDSRELPFFEIASDEASLGEIMESARDWTMTLFWARGEEYENAEGSELKARIIEAHIKAYDSLIYGEHAEIVRLRPDVRETLEIESARLQEALLTLDMGEAE